MSPGRREPTYKRYIREAFERFDENQTAYSRADRGELQGPGDALERGMRQKSKESHPGYSREDYALVVAGRAIDSLCRRTTLSRADMPRRWKLPEDRMEVVDPRAMSEKLKRVARWFGAGEAGVCEVNPSWIYSRWGTHNTKLSPEFKAGDPVELPAGVKYAVVMTLPMDYRDIQRSPAVCPSIDLGYAHQAFAATSVAEFIRGLGYSAIPSGNDMALSIPLAVDAGLGEMGRNGQLITRKHGPRVRLSKVFTDLPLVADEPVDLGVQHFCEACRKCADKCPGAAIPKGERTAEAITPSTSPGMLKWPVNSDRCLAWWYRNGTPGCTNCIRVCPYNKPEGVLHDAVRAVLKRTSRFDRMVLWGDDLLGYDRQVLHETPNRQGYG